jgi:hypothetical protein
VTELAIVVPLLLAAVVALSVVVFARTASAALRQARAASRSGLEVAALAERLERTLDEVVRAFDPLRDGAGPVPLGLAERTAAFESEVRAIAETAQRVEVGWAATPAVARDRLLGIATQAGRALGAVVKVVGSMTPSPEPHPAGAEPRRAAERSLKRAWLDLVHAHTEAAAVAEAGRTTSRRADDGSAG